GVAVWGGAIAATAPGRPGLPAVAARAPGTDVADRIHVYPGLGRPRLSRERGPARPGRRASIIVRVPGPKTPRRNAPARRRRPKAPLRLRQPRRPAAGRRDPRAGRAAEGQADSPRL